MVYSWSIFIEKYLINKNVLFLFLFLIFQNLGPAYFASAEDDFTQSDHTTTCSNTLRDHLSLLQVQRSFQSIVLNQASKSENLPNPLQEKMDAAVVEMLSSVDQYKYHLEVLNLMAIQTPYLFSLDLLEKAKEVFVTEEDFARGSLQGIYQLSMEKLFERVDWIVSDWVEKVLATEKMIFREAQIGAVGSLPANSQNKYSYKNWKSLPPKSRPLGLASRQKFDIWVRLAHNVQNDMNYRRAFSEVLTLQMPLIWKSLNAQLSSIENRATMTYKTLSAVKSLAKMVERCSFGMTLFYGAEFCISLLTHKPPNLSGSISHTMLVYLLTSGTRLVFELSTVIKPFNDESLDILNSHRIEFAKKYEDSLLHRDSYQNLLNANSINRQKIEESLEDIQSLTHEEVDDLDVERKFQQEGENIRNKVVLVEELAKEFVEKFSGDNLVISMKDMDVLSGLDKTLRHINTLSLGSHLLGVRKVERAEALELIKVLNDLLPFLSVTLDLSQDSQNQEKLLKYYNYFLGKINSLSLSASYRNSLLLILMQSTNKVSIDLNQIVALLRTPKTAAPSDPLEDLNSLVSNSVMSSGQDEIFQVRMREHYLIQLKNNLIALNQVHISAQDEMVYMSDCLRMFYELQSLIDSYLGTYGSQHSKSKVSHDEYLNEEKKNQIYNIQIKIENLIEKLQKVMKI